MGSPEVQIARLEERLNVILLELQQARDGRKQQYANQESMARSIIGVENRLAGVEKSLAGQAPTIEEFITIKHKVEGAGIAGKWLWGAGGALLTVVVTCREALFGWLAK